MKKIYDVGINDFDGVVSIKVGGKWTLLKSYSTWVSMLSRCYNEDRRHKAPSYAGCTVCEEWHSYSAYKKWYDENYVEGYEIDKDLLDPTNKVYSPSACLFVPNWLNSFVLNRASLRGEYPLGVSKKRGKFKAQVRIGGKQTHLGTFKTPEEAHEAWKKAKMEQVNFMKPSMDKLDERLYPAIAARYL